MVAWNSFVHESMIGSHGILLTPGLFLAPAFCVPLRLESDRIQAVSTLTRQSMTAIRSPTLGCRSRSLGEGLQLRMEPHLNFVGISAHRKLRKTVLNNRTPRVICQPFLIWHRVKWKESFLFLHSIYIRLRREFGVENEVTLRLPTFPFRFSWFSWVRYSKLIMKYLILARSLLLGSLYKIDLTTVKYLLPLTVVKLVEVAGRASARSQYFLALIPYVEAVVGG